MLTSVPPELMRRFNEDDGVVLFAGAGFSHSAISASNGDPSPMPLAEGLAKDLANLLQEPVTGKLDDYQLGQLADFYLLERRGGKRDLLDWLREQLRDNERRLPDSICWALQSVPFRGFVTTNYDTLLERGLRWQNPDREPVTWTTETFVPPLTPDTVYKLCGTVEKGEDSILLSDKDFDEKFGGQNKEITDRLHQYLKDSTFLFVGYRLQDPFFRLAWSDLLRRFGMMQRRAYAVMRQADPHFVRYWADRQVTIIKSDTSSFLRELLLHFDPTKDLDALLASIAVTKNKSVESVERELRGSMEAGGHPALIDVAIIHWHWLQVERESRPQVRPDEVL